MQSGFLKRDLKMQKKCSDTKAPFKKYISESSSLGTAAYILKGFDILNVLCSLKCLLLQLCQSRHVHLDREDIIIIIIRLLKRGFLGWESPMKNLKMNRDLIFVGS